MHYETAFFTCHYVPLAVKMNKTNVYVFVFDTKYFFLIIKLFLNVNKQHIFYYVLQFFMTFRV